MSTREEVRMYRHMAFSTRMHICEDCGSTEKLEVDHIDENRNNNIPQNLRLLCHECHLKRHNCREKRKINKKFQPGTKHNKRK